MKIKYLILIHTSYWLYVFVLLEVMYKLAYQNKLVSFKTFFEPIALTNYLIFGGIFYINYLYVLPFFFEKKKYFLTILSWALLVVLFVLTRYLIQEKILFTYFGLCNYCGESVNIYIANNFFQGFSYLILVGTVIWFVDNWLHVKKKQMLLLHEKFVAERAFLQSQVSPHFLFNTLNNIYSMVYHGSDKALPAIQKLADIMRYTVKECQFETVDVITELSYLRNYIELQRLRVMNAYIEYKETGNFEKGRIAPMLLISFVENAFKHGVINDPESPLEICITLKAGELRLFVKNKINKNKKDPSPGVGQNNVKNRLDLFYKNKYELLIFKDDIYYYSKLNLPC